ncbi:phospholipase D-like domain-containing protein [Flavivirga rizhaonensis]|uniref:phospholipase D n=1 Tax=Flavivirga rizhaonensis TaxID=2559571 RepID=A0A4V3P522_9FLAO|nr:phospholipase D-like domain-containing protein [Flavivirga rizhaonensis]TGV03624.1 hypothetical protein EM932_06255 [Flavivirga rizhaonensis]
MTKITAHFENHKDVIEFETSTAKSEVLIAVAWINFKEYYSLFETILKNDCKLKILCSDNRQNKSHIKEIIELRKKGASIQLLEMPNTSNYMHHKFAIIDRKNIINGSFNWSPNATRSFENLIVINDNKTIAKEFRDEFKKLELIGKETIRSLRKKVKCTEKECSGEMLNILVLSEKSSKYFETNADIIKFCNECNEYSTIESCLSDTQFEMLLDSYQGSMDDFESEYLDDLISEHLNQHINNNILIHAIGKVTSGLDYYDDDFTNTNILWKNKFVGNRVLDVYENEDFDVLYSN